MGELRRILLVEVTPKVPQPLAFGAYAPASIAPAGKIALSDSNLTALYSGSSTGTAGVRGSVLMQAGQWYWETQAVGTTTLNYAFTGILRADQPANGGGSTTQCVAHSGDGRFVFAGAYTANLGQTANGARIAHWLDLDAGIYRVGRAGVWQIAATGLAVGPGWYPVFMAQISGYGWALRTGAAAPASAALQWECPPSARLYGAAPAPVPTTQYLGSEGFNTEAGDVPSNTAYLGRMDAGAEIEIEREGSCWVWGGQSISRRGQITFVNVDGGLDAWLDYDWRDAPITLYALYEGQPRAKAAVWMTGRVDAVAATQDSKVVLTIADPLAMLDRAIQTNLYPDSQANAALAGKPIPLVIGRPLYCTPVRLDTNPTVRQYQVQDPGAYLPFWIDKPLVTITDIYDMGSRFAGQSDPYVPYTAITLANGGNFSTWVNDPALGAGLNMPQNFGRVTAFGATNDRFLQGAVAGTLRMQSSGQQSTAIFHAASSVLTGSRVAINFDVTAVGKVGTIMFRADGPSNLPFDETTITIATTGAKSVSLDITDSAQLQIVLGRSEVDVTIDNLTVSSVQIIDWTFFPSTVAPWGFVLASQPAGKVVCNPVGPSNIGVPIEFLPGVTSYLGVRAWSSPGNYEQPAISGAAAIDVDAHYRLAAYITEPATILETARSMMDSFCGWVVPDRPGVIQLGRVTEPANAPVLTLDPSNVMGEIQVEDDLAKGLTLRLAGRRNNSPHADSDVLRSVPPALRAELMTEWTCVRTASIALAPNAYAHAVSAPAQASWLMEPADIQAEINRVATLWRKRRRFFTVTALLGASAADALEPGQTVRVVWPRYGLAAGVNLLVVGVVTRFFDRRVQLKLWG